MGSLDGVRCFHLSLWATFGDGFDFPLNLEDVEDVDVVDSCFQAMPSLARMVLKCEQAGWPRRSYRGVHTYRDNVLRDRWGYEDFANLSISRLREEYKC